MFNLQNKTILEELYQELALEQNLPKHNCVSCEQFQNYNSSGFGFQVT